MIYINDNILIKWKRVKNVEFILTNMYLTSVQEVLITITL
jgi:hypothetical protein